MSKEWMSTEHQKRGNEDEWKKTVEQTTKTVASPSQDKETQRRG
jgi:hypothetical protein